MALTKAQIQKKIEELTINKKNCQTDKGKYNDAKKYAIKLETELKNAKASNQSSIDYAKQYFVIDGKIGDGGKLEKLFNDINNSESKIRDIIIPAIDNELSNLTNKISQIDTEINKLKKQLQQCDTNNNVVRVSSN